MDKQTNALWTGARNMKLEDFDLTRDPFAIVPESEVHNWAGHEELKEDLIDLVMRVRASDIGVSEFAILYGEYGAGKSHTLRFLKTYVEQSSNNFHSLAIYVERPRVSKALNFLELYKYIMTHLLRDRLKEFCEQVKTKIYTSVDELIDNTGLSPVEDKSSFLETVINRLPKQDQSMIRLLLRGAIDNQVEKFLIGDISCNGKEYQGTINSDFLASKLLTDLFRVLTLEIRPDERIYESVYLFLDEGEVLIDAKATESELVFAGLRELINGVPYRMGLMISFSAATALIEAVVSQHLLKRMTSPYFEIPMLEDGDAKEFLRAQLDSCRTPDSAHGSTFFPFEEDAIDFIVEHNTQLTPRNLFIDCKRVFERAYRRFDLDVSEPIPRDMAEKILMGIRHI